MYRIPRTSKAFDIDQYFSTVSGASKHIHPDWPVFRSNITAAQLATLLDCIEKSLSLNRYEKKRIFRQKLSKLQVTELIKVFRDESNEFKKLLMSEREPVFNLAVTADKDWRESILPELVTGPNNVDQSDKLARIDILMSAETDSIFTQA